MSSRTRTHVVRLAVGATGVVLALAGCSGGGKNTPAASSTPAASASASAAPASGGQGGGGAAFAQYQDCLRAHGAPVPSFSPGARRPGSGAPTTERSAARLAGSADRAVLVGSASAVTRVPTRHSRPRSRPARACARPADLAGLAVVAARSARRRWPRSPVACLTTVCRSPALTHRRCCAGSTVATRRPPRR